MDETPAATAGNVLPPRMTVGAELLVVVPSPYCPAVSSPCVQASRQTTVIGHALATEMMLSAASLALPHDWHMPPTHPALHPPTPIPNPPGSHLVPHTYPARHAAILQQAARVHQSGGDVVEFQVAKDWDGHQSVFAGSISQLADIVRSYQA